MEYVEAILYHKIMESDFTNMYTTKKPDGGGGQSYIQAAGYSRKELEEMFSHAKHTVNTGKFWDADCLYPRKRFTINAAAVGGTVVQEIEITPRTGSRADYRISRQNVRNRHPAWTPKNGFPAPECELTAKGTQYIYEKNYPGKIDHLYVLILLTRSADGEYKYYADFVNSPTMPSEWPRGVGLEAMFTGPKKKGGIVFFSDEFIRFTNTKASIFASGSAIDQEIGGSLVLPKEIDETPEDAVEYVKKEIKQFDVADISIVGLEKVPAPTATSKSRKASTREKESSRIKTGKKTDFLARQKNLKKIGDLGEKLALEAEKRKLEDAGRSDLAARVEHVSLTQGDGLGYDIQSFELIGDGDYRPKYIEVKSTTGGKNKPFDISANEVLASEELGEQYSIYRFFGLHNQTTSVRYYEIQGPVTDHFSLEPTAFRAYLK